MPLKAIVVGAGIAGLCAGIALRQAGHIVEIFEKSILASEIGAALVISPNGARVLSRLGFSFSAAQAVEIDTWSVLCGNNLQPMTSVDLSSATERFGAGVWSIHRVDLHSELLRLATSQADPGHPIQIHLASEVVSGTKDGSITLRSGSKHLADLVIAADGLHSTLKAVVLGQDAMRPSPTGLSAFRFLIDTQKLIESILSPETLLKQSHEATLLADIEDTARERHMMCGEMQNFVGIHPTRDINGDDAKAVKGVMLDEFGHFAPEVLEIIRQASHVKCWPLFVHRPLSTWFTGRVVLIGDAAHPMLPFGGQGSNSAVEDGGSLGYLFRDVEAADMIPERLRLFGRARQARAARVQILSSVRAGKEKEVEEQLLRYCDPPGTSVPTNMAERTAHDYGFDAFEKCDEVLLRA